MTDTTDLSLLCTVADCTRPRATRSWCKPHYMRWWRYGDPSHIPQKPEPRICEVDGCEKPHAGRGYCVMHLYRFYKRGDPGPAEMSRAPGGAGGVMLSGYRLLTRPGHPLAGSQHKVYEHRVVLYDTIGPGTHPCHWCALPLRWDGRWPIDLDALTVDHLDGDKLNNRPENLVPSCNECNTQRGRRGSK